MTKVHHLMALLSFSRTFAPALGHVNRDYGYGDPILLQPTITATVTTTEISTVTVGGSTCDAICTPTTVTVYTGCASTSDISSVSGLPLSSYSSHGPWVNATSTPCTHGSTPSSAIPSDLSSSLGWNHTTVISLPTLTGTAGTTIETADPIGTSSVHWTNSTRSSTAEEDWTSVITLTVTSSAVVTVNATVTSGYSAPSSGFNTGTGLPGHDSSDVPTSYHPSLTYQTTTRAPSSIPTNGTATNTWSSVPTHTWSLPPSWNISTISGSPTNTSSHTILTTETNDPIFTNPTSSPIPTWSNTTITPAWPTTSVISLTLPPSPSAPSISTSTSTATTNADDNSGGEYGSYSYPSPSSSIFSSSSFSTSASPSPSSSSADASTVESVDPIGGTATTTTTPTHIHSTTAASSLSVPTTLLIATSRAAGESSTDRVQSTTTTTALQEPGHGYGGGYGYGGY